MSGCYNSEKCECFGCLRAQLCALEQTVKRLADSHTDHAITISRLGKLISDKDNKKPLACPICNGKGIVSLEPFDELFIAKFPINKVCQPCEGKGVFFV